MDKYPTIEFTGKETDKVKGILYEVSNLDLHHIDLYESLAYARKQVVLVSGANAWVYIPNLG
ncbi:Hypothetical protein I595_1977 [Croceitalea dokdonensis DOKDO 023]|uniref:Gamma-glutamylcyclotransferase AIG2-like domain-containing protein n=2 Tax=Croceitalea TaxID=574891 RepID=A0A0P7AG07_9FLAO|nr:Hypothetical protein I595_1977 [Croceitalea dokdonensis DOKDO 023]